MNNHISRYLDQDGNILYYDQDMFQYRKSPGEFVRLDGLGSFELKMGSSAAKLAATIAFMTGGPTNPIGIASTAVAGTLALIDSLDKSEERKNLAIQRGEYETANKELISQNFQLDEKINELNSGLINVKNQINQVGLSGPVEKTAREKFKEGNSTNLDLRERLHKLVMNLVQLLRKQGYQIDNDSQLAEFLKSQGFKVDSDFHFLGSLVNTKKSKATFWVLGGIAVIGITARVLTRRTKKTK